MRKISSALPAQRGISFSHRTILQQMDVQFLAWKCHPVTTQSGKAFTFLLGSLVSFKRTGRTMIYFETLRRAEMYVYVLMQKQRKNINILRKAQIYLLSLLTAKRLATILFPRFTKKGKWPATCLAVFSSFFLSSNDVCDTSSSQGYAI